jgi:hypothetical protein
VKIQPEWVLGEAGGHKKPFGGNRKLSAEIIDPTIHIFMRGSPENKNSPSQQLSNGLYLCASLTVICQRKATAPPFFSFLFFFNLSARAHPP